MLLLLLLLLFVIVFAVSSEADGVLKAEWHQGPGSILPELRAHIKKILVVPVWQYVRLAPNAI